MGKERPRFSWAKIRGKSTEIERSIWWRASKAKIRGKRTEIERSIWWGASRAKIRGKSTEIERSIWWGARETTWKVLVGNKMFWMGKSTEIDIVIFFIFLFFSEKKKN